ncbi:hypothetical protein ATO3_16150 [Marinibacterium profundimaris]|uniref:Integrin n=1 Tax=Marinibacterium profundimaris TaxID=1679460 RepID=A0A225NGP6_9RHOB|nr:hypothetical protein ATO3_16150 [Marinibacterium profundimaris]
MVLCLWHGAGGAVAQQITSARYVEPVTRYGHGVLGDAVEYGALRISVGQGADRLIRLPESHVFEDISPRLVDLDLDGRADAVMVVETDMARGAALALYGPTGKIAQTPHIGQTHRWLAPLGAADLDRDGRVEIAYVDRPHLARILRIWRFRDGALQPVAEARGLTNHRIGEAFISGGIRDCGAGPEIVTADAGWSRIMVSRLEAGRIATRPVGAFTGAAGMRAVLACR